LQAARRAVVVTNGVDVEAALTAHPYEHGRPYVLCVARLDLSRKAIDTLVSAFRRVADSYPTVDLLVAGSGRDSDRIAALVSSLGLDERVRVLGAVSREALWSLYKGCLFFALPVRFREGLGVVYLEAMAAGKAVIGSDMGGVREAITHGENGLLLRRDAAEEVADALRALLENPDLRKRMGERGRQRVMERHAWPTIAARYLEILRGTTA
jgi:phosphatidyl-myo-inositol dimannoside synthase